MSLPSSPAGPPASADSPWSAPPPQRARTGLRRLLRYFLLAALCVLALRALPQEISRWYEAAAIEAELDEGLPRAIAQLDRAIAWAPHSTRLYRRRADIKFQAGQLAGCLEDCNRAIDEAPDDVAAYSLRAQTYQRMGRHGDAVEDWDYWVSKARQQYEQNPTDRTRLDYANYLNGRAYARALGNFQIDQGLRDIELAFQVLGTKRYEMLDTRGYLRLLAGDLPGAKSDMERAVDLAELDYRAELNNLEQWRKERVDQRAFNLAQNVHRQQLSILYQHRGLVYEALGRTDEAQADLKLAKELGYDPEKGIW
jgi:tetratricopeptide (TPR) repeat protein